MAPPTRRKTRRTEAVEIRPATSADHDAIWQVLEPVFRAGETYCVPRDISKEEALAYWCGAGNQVFVAEADGMVLGSYILRANQKGGGAHVANCGYVTGEAARGRGVARAMLEHSLDHARQCGFTAMQFNFVIANNSRAVKTWQAYGFEIVGRLPQAFDHPVDGLVDALVMYRRL